MYSGGDNHYAASTVWIDGFVYGGSDGEVVEYGPPNGRFLYECRSGSSGSTGERRVQMRARWDFYLVDIFFMRGGRWLRGCRYHAATWNAIEKVWMHFFATAGLYERVAWSCEQWSWSYEEGFAPFDYI